MYQFKDNRVRKEYYLERFEERLEFRKKFKYFLAVFVISYVVSGLLAAFAKNMTWTFFAVRTAGMTVVFVLYLIVTKLKYFKNISEGKKIFYVDFFIFFPLLTLNTSLTGFAVKEGINVAQEDSLNGYFYAFDLSYTYIWTMVLSEFMITNWMFRITYFLGYWACIFVNKAISFPTAAGFFNDFRNMIYLIILIVYQERSSRLNFVTKRDRKKKIEMFESILKRIHEQIVVFNRNMEIKYSNINGGSSPDENVSKLTPENIIEKITSLRLMPGSILNTDFVKLFEKTELNEGINLTQCLEQIATTDEFYNELEGRDYIQIEGRSYESSTLSKTPVPSEIRYYTLQLFTNCLHDEECIVVIIKDITDHISMLQEKNNLQANLLSSLSHELKTPLGITLGLIDKAIEDHKTPLELSKKYLVPAVNYGNMLTCFINDVFDFIKLQKNEFQLKIDYFCIENLLEETTKLFSSTLKKKDLTLQIDYDESARTVIHNDPQRLKQVLVNLLGNAIKYTMQGSVTLGFKCIEEATYLFYVKDTGIGIREEELEVLNNKLESIDFCVRVNENSTGAGIGLIVANTITKRLNPKTGFGLSIESEYGAGSKFSFSIENITLESRSRRGSIFEYKGEEGGLSPVAKVSRVLISSFKSPEELFSLRPTSRRDEHKNFLTHSEDNLPSQDLGLHCCKRILVVDDEVFNTVAVEMICKPFGFSVDCAFNGEQALEFIQRRASEACENDCQPYRMIIMDCNMPVMDGYQATRCIRESIKEGLWKDMVIVGCTAYEGKEKLDECLRSGMNTYVKKPLDNHKFTQLLSKFTIQ